MVPADRPGLLPALTRHFVGEVARIAAAMPNDRIALQWDVCQEVLGWEGYYDQGPIDFRTETIEVLAAIGDAVPRDIELGYHLCYGSPADEHLVQPRDTGIMVEMTNAIVAGVRRPIQYFHIPVPKALPAPGRRLLPAARGGCSFARRRRSISASSITTTPQAMRRVWPPPGGTCAWTASPPNAAWRAEIPPGSPRCWRRMSGRRRSPRKRRYLRFRRALHPDIIGANNNAIPASKE